MVWWLLAGLVVAEAKPPKAVKVPPPVVVEAPVRARISAPDDVAGPPEGVSRTASGLAWRLLKAGEDGPRPTEMSRVMVHYTGWTTDGEMFDSSVERGEPATFPLTSVISGWTEGLQLLRRGDVARFWIPEALAYQGRAGAPAGMLVFDVELIDFATPPPTPLDVSGPPPVATRSITGLAWRPLAAGSGKVSPTDRAVVTVHYSVWTTEGKLVDSSVMRGEPMQVPVSEVVPGWQEALRTMVVGERRRLWVPGVLGRGRGTPTLVFDVELLGFEEQASEAP